MKSVVVLFILSLSVLFVACDSNQKLMQTITFNELASQLLRDSTLTLSGTASSGLRVHYLSSDSAIATIVNDTTVKFIQSGTVNITAFQPGNETFYEAGNITQQLKIHDWDPNKLTQTISFELIAEKRISTGIIIPLEATSSSGLPVKFTSNDSHAVISGSYLLLYHGTRTYDVSVQITASQSGNAIYNPAENVVRTLHIIGDETH